MGMREVVAMATGEKASDDDKDKVVPFNIRVPEGNLEEARRRANSRGISLNAWICDAIADKLEDTGRIVPFRKP